MTGFKYLSILIVLASQPSAIFAVPERTKLLTKFVQNVIVNEEVPSVLGAFTCWSRDDDFYFVKTLPVPIQIIKSAAQIRKPEDDIVNKYWLFIDMKCSSSSVVVNEINSTFFAHPFRWIMVDAAKDVIENLPLLPDSNVILANFNAPQNEFILMQPYKIGKNLTSFIYERFGFGTFTEFVDNRSTRILSRRRRNLNGLPLKTALVFMEKGSENFRDLDDYHHNRVDTVTKLSYLIATHWVGAVNATMIETLYPEWGYYDKKTGRVTGMSGALKRKEEDIGGTVIFVTANRIPYLEYLTMVIPTYAAFVLRSPPLSYVSNIYYLPFTGLVWICSFSLIVLSIAIIAVTIKTSKTPDAKKWEISDYFMLGVASLCQASDHIVSHRISTRIAMFFLLVAILFIYTSFTANIVALLQSTTNRFKTLSDLMHPSIELGVHHSSFNRYYFAAASDPVRKALYEARVAPKGKPDRFMNESYGVSLMRQGMFAFHMEVGTGYTEVERTFYEHEKCGLVEIPFLQVTHPWMVIQKHSPYKEILKVNLMKIREHGIQLRERGRVYSDRPKCNADGKNFGSVRLIDCYAAFVLFGYGAGASVFLLLAEYVVAKVKSFQRINE